MKDIETVTLENGKSYLVVKEIVIDRVKYVYLANEDDYKDFCVRKVNIINGAEYLVNLSNEDEFKKALDEFNNEYHS